MAQLIEFGKEIKKRLIDLDRNQSWLIEEMQKETGLFVDTSYLYKIMTGQRSAPKLTDAIKKILSIQN